MNVRLGRGARVMAPGYGLCHRCQTPWRFVTPHVTRYVEPPPYGKGCFPLCEKCWADLDPQMRLPYYEWLFAEWGKDGAEDGEWEACRQAVLAGQ